MGIRLQSAMEYLMTYGWAILAIAIVMVSLYSLGIFNTGNLQPTATPGSCEVIRTAAQTSLAGQCSNLIPKYVGQFNGANSYILTTYGGSSSTFSISLWFDTLSTNQQYFFSDNQHATNWFAMGYNSGGVSIDIAGSSYQASAISDNRWYHYVMTYDGATERSYLNGVYVGSLSTSLSAFSAFYTGLFNLYNQQTEGLIANVQIYNTSLDNASVKALYQEGIGGAPIDISHLVGWWPLNGDANDYSGNNNQGTPTKVTWNANWQSGYSAPTT